MKAPRDSQFLGTEKINKLYDQNGCFLCIMDKDVL